MLYDFHASHFINRVSSRAISMQFSVTFPANKFEIVPAQRYVWVAYVLRCDVYLVVHDLAD